jgi:hypothetical protein
MGYRERYEDDYGGHPLIATLVAAGVLLLTLGIPLHLPERSGAGYREGYLIGQFVLGPLIVWGIAYAVTIRKASPGWKIGSLVAITLVSAAVTLARMGAPVVALEQDMRGVANELQAVVDADGNVSEIPITADAGPLTRLNATLLNAVIGDVAAYNREAGAAGIDDFDSATLRKSAPVLKHCDRIAALPARAAWYKGRFDEHLAEALRTAEGAVRARALPHEALAGFEEGARSNRFKLDRRWDRFAGIAEENAGICRLLAASAWQNRGGKILFNRQADLDTLNSHVARIKAYADEDALARAEAKTATQQRIDDIQQQH